MAEIDLEMDADKRNMKEKAKDTIANNRRGLGVGAAAAIFTTGFLMGQKRAENNSIYSKLLRQIK